MKFIVACLGVIFCTHAVFAQSNGSMNPNSKQPTSHQVRSEVRVERNEYSTSYSITRESCVITISTFNNRPNFYKIASSIVGNERSDCATDLMSPQFASAYRTLFETIKPASEIKLFLDVTSYIEAWKQSVNAHRASRAWRSMAYPQRLPDTKKAAYWAWYKQEYLKTNLFGVLDNILPQIGYRVSDVSWEKFGCPRVKAILRGIPYPINLNEIKIKPVERVCLPLMTYVTLTKK